MIIVGCGRLNRRAERPDDNNHNDNDDSNNNTNDTIDTNTNNNDNTNDINDTDIIITILMLIGDDITTNNDNHIHIYTVSRSLWRRESLRAEDYTPELTKVKFQWEIH